MAGMYICQWQNPDDSDYCIADYILASLSLLTLLLSSVQIVVHLKLSFNMRRLRMRILYLSVLQCLLTFIHYGYLSLNTRGFTTPLIDINKYFISYCLFYFFLDKASGLLPD